MEPAAAEATPNATLAQATALRERLGVSRVLIHHIPFAVSADAGNGFTQPGPFCPNPRKSTGAGDPFNPNACKEIAGAPQYVVVL
jgi:hypothetical protein